MSTELQDQIEEFKKYRIDKSPEEIIQHYKKELQAMQDALDIISGRWKMQIIALLCNGEFRYSELQKGLGKISPRTLSRELKDLEVNDLVRRRASDDIPVKVSYKLTDYGYTLVPIIIELTNWGKVHRARLMHGVDVLSEETPLVDVR